MKTTGRVNGIISNIVIVKADGAVGQNEICYVYTGDTKMMAEVIKVVGDSAYVQVFDSTRGLKIGDRVEFEGHMLEVTLAPGLLSRNYDGLQNDLEKMDGLFIARGSITDPVDFSAEWEFAPLAKAGDKVSAASWLGEVKEQWVSHKIMVPFTMTGNYTVKSIVAAGKYKVTDTVAVVTDDEGREHGITMVQKWPVKQAVRCYVEKPRPSRVMVTGVRAIDTFNPMAEGGTGFIPGPFGAGKTVLQHAISKQADDDIIIIDPEAEYRPLVEGLGGQVINISATSPNHINAMDMEKGYGDGENPVVLKSEFLLSLCEQLIGAGKLSAKEKSIIDRCTAQVYRDYIRGGYQGQAPTLQDFHAELLRQPEKEAADVALAIELFTEGSLNTFAKPTNVDTNARILCYDIRDLGKQLLPVGMLVVLDSIFNRIIRNRGLKRNTWIYIDEIYLLFQHEYSANFLFTLWKRMRKYQACGTGISQNIEDLLQSHTARTMLANSEFLVLLNQAATDREELARLLNISDNQLSYITNVDSGRGLIKCGSAIVPFVDHFPKNKLYQMMTTKPSDLAS